MTKNVILTFALEGGEKNMVKKLLGALIATIAVLGFASSANAQTVLKNAFVSSSNALESQTPTHTFTFFHPGSQLGSATFQYCTTASSTCTATGVTLNTAGSDSVEENAVADANWTLNPAPALSEALEIARSSADTDANNTWEFAFDTVTIPALSSLTCSASQLNNTKTCYVRVNTYSSTNYTTSTGSTTVSFTVTSPVQITATVDPSFSLVISGVQPGQTANANGVALTAGLTPTVTSLPFRNLTPGTEKFIAQSATVTTNAFGGYTITARMNNNMAGTAYGDDIDGFTGNSATISSSKSWLLPTGTASGTNTGWLGVGTDDGDVSGQGASQFFTLGTGITTLATQSTSAQSELDIFVFGIEVNSYQRADSYSGTLRYNALPVY